MNIETKKEGTKLTFYLDSELNTRAAPEFEAAFQQYKAGATEVIVDMEQLTYITSAGVRVLLTIQQDMEELNGSLVICHVNDSVLDVFDVTGFSSFLHIQ